MSSAIQRLLGRLRNTEQSVRDSIAELVQEAGSEAALGAAGDPVGLDVHERALIANVLRLREITADDVMVPRPDIVAMRANVTLAEAIDQIRAEGHSRLPVYRNDLDDILGMVHIKDVFAYSGSPESFSLESILRKPLMVAPQITVLDLLLQMRQTRTHLALVVDEYGGIDGLVTIEDLVETIVGDIADEHDDDDEVAMISKQGEDSWIADARISISTLDQMFKVDLLPAEEEDEADTLGGLIFEMHGRVPNKGEVISHPSGLEFEIMQSDPRRVKKVKIFHKPKPETEEAGD